MALDQAGGSHVAIDYSLMIEERPRDEAVRSALLHQLDSLPFENLVLRASHFGADAEAPQVRAFINMLDRLMEGGQLSYAQRGGEYPTTQHLGSKPLSPIA